MAKKRSSTRVVTSVNTMVLCASLAALTLSLVGHALSGPSCGTGWYGPECNLSCGSTCKAYRCQAEPEQGIYRCTSGCAEGSSGMSCRRKCPRNCALCDQITGVCSKCLDGWCGDNCTALCNGSGIDSGQCLDEACTYCQNGWYGTTCDSRCPEHCDDGCNKLKGICDHQCRPGYRGSLCTKPCSTTCKSRCQQTDGECTDGCQTGWFGQFCNMSCNASCKYDICYQYSGECSSGVVSPLSKHPKCALVWKDSGMTSDCRKGCLVGWRGERCDQPCPSQCYSCPRFPTGRMCLYLQNVTAVRTYNFLEETSEETLGKRAIFTLVLVLFPFVIVGFVQVLRLGVHRLRMRRKKEYTLCESKPGDSKC